MAFNQIVRRAVPGLRKTLQNSALTRAVPTLVINRSSSVNVEEEIEREEKNQVSLLRAIYERYNKMFGEPEKKVMSEEEKAERHALWEKVGAMYYEKPPRSPTAETYIEGFELLMKWDDRRGLENLWTSAENELIVFDDDVIDKVEDYMIDARRRAWNE